VTIAMRPQPRTADQHIDSGLAELVAAVGAPAAPVPSAEVVAVLARATAVLGGRELRAATRLAAERLERSLPTTEPLPARPAGASAGPAPTTWPASAPSCWRPAGRPARWPACGWPTPWPRPCTPPDPRAPTPTRAASWSGTRRPPPTRAPGRWPKPSPR